MDYEYREIDIDEWCEIIEGSDINVFGSRDFLLATAKIYKFKLLFSLISYNNRSVLALPLFVKGHRIILPNHYFYQSLWQCKEEGESWLLLDAWNVLLKELQHRYVKIKIRLPSLLKDCRPFIWNNFVIDTKYTYLKDLNNLNYHHNIKRIIKKEKPEYSFKKNCDWEDSWLFHNLDLRRFGVRSVHVHFYIRYFKALKDKGIIQVFNAYYHNVFLTSIVAIVDTGLKIAYFPLIGTADGHYNSGLSSLLYDYALKELKTEGFKKVDLVGANIKNIARFKSKFLPELIPFFEVSYSGRREFFKQKFLKIKRFAGRILFWVR